MLWRGVVLNNTSFFLLVFVFAASWLCVTSHVYPPKPYSVLPWRLSAYTTSIAVTVLRRACSV